MKDYGEVQGSNSDSVKALDGDLTTCSTAGETQHLSIELNRQYRIVGLALHILNDGPALGRYN